MKTKYLFHGSIQLIQGEKLLPKKAKDLGENPENSHSAIYATDKKEIAIAMAIISCKKVKWSSLRFTKKPFGTIYEGWPEQKYIYLYTLLSETFKQSNGLKNQFYSTQAVKPIKVEKLKIEDYISLVRKSTKEEKEIFIDKYRLKI